MVQPVLGILTCCLVVASATTLRDLYRPNREITSFLRSLQKEVEQEFSKEIQFDQGEVYPVINPADPLTALNANYSDLLFEGDIRLSHAAIVSLRGRTRRQATRAVNLLWRDGVPYALDKGLSATKRKVVQQAISFWNSETCVNFRPRGKEINYLNFVGHDQGCWSSVGMDIKQKGQWISIGEGCQLFGIAAHEIGHALGVFHQQSRPDRDNFVSIMWSRIKRNFQGNFAKGHKTNSYDLPYDYGSVMHYGPTSFAIDKKTATISATDANYFLTMGNREGPSFLDVALVNQLYSCQYRCPPIRCENGGYVDPRNCGTCKCAPVFTGAYCQLPNYGTCGESVYVGDEFQTFDRKVLKSENCIFHFEAPEGKHVQFELVKVEGVCSYGCYEDRVEFRVDKERLSTGYRYCCPLDRPRRFTAASSSAAVILKAAKESVVVQFRYRAMRSLIVFVVVVGLSFEAIPCDIDVKLASKTDKKFRVDLFVPSLKVKADNIVFNGHDQNKKINVKGADCDSQKWMVQSFRLNNETHEWEQVKNVTAKFFGNGYIKFIFNDDLEPTLKDKVGVWSSEGDWWGK